MAEGAAVGALFEVPNVPPSVVLDSPVPDSLLTAPATIVLAATAEDVDGGIVQVEFLQGGTSLGVDTEPPYEVAWADVPAGVYALTARAIDVRGRVTTSGPVAATVETRFVATADTYVLSRSLTILRNHGSDTRLRVRHAGARSTYWAYLKFDTTDVMDVSGARIRLRGAQMVGPTALPTSAYPVTDTSWDERLLSWGNRPDSGETALATVALDNSTTSQAWYEWDVTDHILQEKAAGRDVVSFVIRVDEPSRQYGWFWSREAVIHQPELVITP